MSRIDLIPETILACCILHNICLNGVDNDIENYILDGEAINNEVDIKDENEGLNSEKDILGINKRNYIAQGLYMLNQDNVV
ncbi:unnamed protein product [Lasius platythorax]|uniref:DDE Tnp4 domain-containing protein n=1 Tax=Lasius platythorax TaxID=488582 RepID=A0AAV2NSW2_9HYME